MKDVLLGLTAAIALSAVPLAYGQSQDDEPLDEISFPSEEMPPADADSAVALDPATSVKSDEDPSMVVGDSDTDSGVVTVDSDVDSGVAAISNDTDSSAASLDGDANSEAAQLLDVIPVKRLHPEEIGRASCRERWWQSGTILVVA